MSSRPITEQTEIIMSDDPIEKSMVPVWTSGNSELVWGLVPTVQVRVSDTNWSAIYAVEPGKYHRFKYKTLGQLTHYTLDDKYLGGMSGLPEDAQLEFSIVYSQYVGETRREVSICHVSLGLSGEIGIYIGNDGKPERRDGEVPNTCTIYTFETQELVENRHGLLKFRATVESEDEDEE